MADQEQKAILWQEALTDSMPLTDAVESFRNSLLVHATDVYPVFPLQSGPRDFYEQLARFEAEVSGIALTHETFARRLKAIEMRVESFDAPKVRYVVSQDNSTLEPRMSKQNATFILVGLACSIIFGMLLALFAFGIQWVHPLFALVGLVGGLGWLTTGVIDFVYSGTQRNDRKAQATNEAVAYSA